MAGDISFTPDPNNPDITAMPLEVQALKEAIKKTDPKKANGQPFTDADIEAILFDGLQE